MPPLPGGGRGFESPRLHSRDIAFCRQNAAFWGWRPALLGAAYCDRNVAGVLADGIVLERGWLRRAARLLVVVLREVEHWPERTADCPYRRFAFRGGVLGFLLGSLS